MARIQLKLWQAPLSILSSPPPVGLAEGEVGIATETGTLVKRPDGDDNGNLISLGGESNFIRPRAATTSHINLNGLQTIDNVFLNAGDIVLVKDQTDPRLNGIYVASVGQWTRYVHADSTSALAKSVIVVEAGSTNGDTLWVCTVNRDAAAIGLVDINFRKPYGSGNTEGAGEPGGSATLGEDGKLEASQLPTGAGGVPVLDSEGKIPVTDLKTGANGVLLLNANGKMDVAALPTGANGVLLLNANGKVDVATLPTGANGVPVLDTNGKMAVTALPTGANGVPVLDANSKLSGTNLPIASTGSLGAVKIGSGLAMDAQGILSVTVDPGAGTIGEDGKMDINLIPALSATYATRDSLPATGQTGLTYITSEGNFYWDGSTYQSSITVIDGGTF